MPAAQHDFTATEIRAGILVLVSLVILAGFVAAIRGCRPHDDSAKEYCATFTDISGLNKGADVRASPWRLKATSQSTKAAWPASSR